MSSVANRVQVIAKRPKFRPPPKSRKGVSSARAAATMSRDPLFNQSVEKAFAVLGVFSAERRVQGLAEIAAAAQMTTGSAQRCVHTLVQLGYLQRVARLHGWALTSKTLAIGYPYLAGHVILEQATIHLADLNHATGESVSLSEPDGVDMVFIARFPSHKRFFIHMSVGRRLPMYCTASGRAYLSALPKAEVRAILERSRLRKLTPHTLRDIPRILEIIDAARELGYAWANQECYLGDLTIGAPILGKDGRPVASVNLSGPTSRWNLAELRERLAPLLLETARAASGRVATSHGA
jgi:IclR family transcriptional regulator, pca regulon regulatory protein